jgi:hypothetical protein
MNAFKQLPWGSLFLAAILAVTIVKAIDYVAIQSILLLKTDAALYRLLATPAGGLVLFGCGGLAIGGLGVLCLERVGRLRIIQNNILWALVLCLLISLWLLSKLPVDGLGLVAFSQIHMLGVLLGVFWQGRAYWR